MAKTFSLHSLLLLLISTAAATPPSPPPHHHYHPHSPHHRRSHHPQPTPSPPPQTPPPLQSPPPPTTTTPPLENLPEFQELQLNNILNALMNSANFSGWARFLNSVNPSSLPITATLFLPGNDAVSHFPTATAAAINFDPFLIPYHIIPQRLSFSDLRLFAAASRLPTLLPSQTILITNNSASNFTVDGVKITHPDVYLTSAISVHGISNILDYTLYGESFFSPEKMAPPPARPFYPAGEVMGVGESGAAACLCDEFALLFLVVFAALAFRVFVNFGG